MSEGMNSILEVNVCILTTLIFSFISYKIINTHCVFVENMENNRKAHICCLKTHYPEITTVNIFLYYLPSLLFIHLSNHHLFIYLF